MDEDLQLLRSYTDSYKALDESVKRELNPDNMHRMNEFEKLSFTICKITKREGYELLPKEVIPILRKNYEYGAIRYTDDFDKATEVVLDELVNSEGNLRPDIGDVASSKYRAVNNLIEELKDGKRCNYFGDFTKRTINDLGNKIWDKYGTFEEKQFRYKNGATYSTLSEEVDFFLSHSLKTVANSTLGEQQAVRNNVHQLNDIQSYQKRPQENVANSNAAQFK